jgi:hypothetical protein
MLTFARASHALNDNSGVAFSDSQPVLRAAVTLSRIDMPWDSLDTDYGYRDLIATYRCGVPSAALTPRSTHTSHSVQRASHPHVGPIGVRVKIPKRRDRTIAGAATKLMPEASATGESVHDAHPVDPSQVEIAGVAYQLWLARGCPQGSDQEDWFRAEEVLKLQ